MRKIYQNYFDIPEENKGIMSERVFFARLMVAIACIVLCLSAMGFSAYAFFTASVSSNMNQIQAANYSLGVHSTIVLVNESGSVAADAHNPNKYILQKGMYDFTLVKSGSASTGYCKIIIDGNEVAVTSQIEEQPITVRIEVAQETVVEFVACWGTYSNTERFDEQNKMIIVDNNQSVSIVAKSETVTVSAIEPQANEIGETENDLVESKESEDVTDPPDTTE